MYVDFGASVDTRAIEFRASPKFCMRVWVGAWPLGNTVITNVNCKCDYLLST